MKKNIKIGIVVADDDEYRPIEERFEKFGLSEYSFLGRKGHTFNISGTAADAEIVTLLCGIGKVNAAAAATHLVDEKCDIILNYGLSGGISGVKRGDICACDKFLEHDFDLTGIGYKPCEKPSQKYVYEADKRLVWAFSSVVSGLKTGTAVTGDHFVCDAGRRDFLKNTFNATCCDMETAAIAYVCNFAGVPFATLRRISDDAGADAGDSYREMNTSSEDNLTEVLLTCIKALLNSQSLIMNL